MIQDIPISSMQRHLLQQAGQQVQTAQANFDAIVTVILAGHDLQGHFRATFTDGALAIELPDTGVDPAAVADPPSAPEPVPA